MPVKPLHPDKLHAVRQLGKTYVKTTPQYKIGKGKKKANMTHGITTEGHIKARNLIERLAYKLHKQRSEHGLGEG